MGRRHRRRREPGLVPEARTARDAGPATVWREVDRVERLSYTRRHAADALGVSLATLDRRIVPSIDTVKLPSGTRLIPVSALDEYLADHLEPACVRATSTHRGRPWSVPDAVVARIRQERDAGRSLAAIVAGLNSDRVPTSQGGSRWWPSTMRLLLDR